MATASRLPQRRDWSAPTPVQAILRSLMMNTRTDPAAPADQGFCAGPESEGSDRLLAFRERFPILARTNYLISNSLGAVPVGANSNLQNYYEAWATRGVRAWEES